MPPEHQHPFQEVIVVFSSQFMSIGGMVMVVLSDREPVKGRFQWFFSKIGLDLIHEGDITVQLHCD